MYKALYRKYRPSSFDDLVDQDVVKQTLTNAIINNKIAHAYLFCGPRGIGKTSVAKLFGKIINCEHLNGVEPCNKCSFCTQYNSSDVNDIIEIDAASNNGVDEIRELKSKVSLMPSVGKYKVYIIDEVHMLTTGAFNALLKTLEEPPSHAIFILATTEVHKIPETIISRCQRFDFNKISNKALCSRLRYIADCEHIKVTDEALSCIAETVNGGMRDAVGLLDEASAYASDNITINDILTISGGISYDEIKNIFIMLSKDDITSILLKISEYQKLGKNLKNFFEKIINYLRNILIIKQASGYNIDEINEKDYEEVIGLYNSSQIIKMIKLFSEYLSEIKKYNIPAIALELAFIELINFDEKESKVNINIIQNKNDEIENNDLANDNDNKELNPEFEKIRNNRINNALAGFNKKEMIEIRNQIDNMRPLILDTNVSEYVSIMLDGEIKAASSEYIIFVFPNKRILKNFDNNVFKIENVIENNLKHKYKIVGTSNISWEIIKKEFNSKQKKYIYEEIDDSILYQSPNNSSEMEQLFGDIVEMK